MIVLAATPIGNLGDASRRLIETLENADIVAAEDTRVTARLLQGLGIQNRPRLIALHEHNETAKAAELIEQARTVDIVVLSDAGMPAISDPGFVLVRAAVEAEVTVTALPGPSAVITALAVSGLPTDRFAFEGFLPRKEGERRAALERLADDPRTLVFFESPHRLADSLSDVAQVLGADRPTVVCRELTKLHEEVKRGSALELAAWAAEGVRGEIVVLVGGAAPRTADATDAVDQVLALAAEGVRLKEAAADVARATGLRANALYDAAILARNARKHAADG